MTHLQRIEAHLASHPGLCDDCFARELEISRRQNVRTICARSHTIRRTNGTCRTCEKVRWRQHLMGSSAWKLLDPKHTILDLPKTGDLSPDSIYLVYLTPKHSAHSAGGANG